MLLKILVNKYWFTDFKSYYQVHLVRFLSTKSIFSLLLLILDKQGFFYVILLACNT